MRKALVESLAKDKGHKKIDIYNFFYQCRTRTFLRSHYFIFEQLENGKQLKLDIPKLKILGHCNVYSKVGMGS